jgi:hypothetical protein
MTAVGLMVLFKPANPSLAAALIENKKHLFSLGIFRSYKMLTLGSLALTSIALTTLSRMRWVGLTSAVLVFVAAFYLTGRAISAPELHASYHYFARTGVAFALPCFALAVLWIEVWGLPVAHAPAAAILLALLASQGMYQVRFNREWVNFRTTLEADLARSEASGPLIPLPDTTVQQLSSSGQPAGRFLWPWSIPFLSAVLPTRDGKQRHHIIIEDPPGYIPVTCTNAKRMADQIRLLAEPTAQALIARFCAATLN